MRIDNMRTSFYNVIVNLSEEDEEYLLFHGYSGAVDIVSKDIAEVLGASEECKQFPKVFNKDEVFQKLLRRGYITEKSQKEEEAVLEGMVNAMHKSKKPPAFLVIPSYNCNLRCSYCYQQAMFLKSGQLSRLGRIMSRNLADKAFDAMHQLWKEYEETSQQKHKLKPKILFYGGEPFLNRNYDIVSYIIEKGQKLGFTFSAITNGTRINKFLPLFGSPEIFTFFQITIDGPPQVHNKRRKYGSGKGSFEEIARNISLLLEAGYKVSLRINIDAENLDHVKELANIIDERGWRNYSNFDAYCAVIRLNGGNRCIEEPLFSQKLEEILGKKYSYFLPSHGRVYSMFRRIFEIGGRPEFSSASCSAMTGQFIFDPYGNLYACWDSAGCPVGKIGQYAPELDFDEGLLQWRNRTVADIPQCRSCPYALLCRGGCAQYAYYATGSLYTPYCDGFSELFENQVRLAYRDLRIQQAKQAARAQEGLTVPMFIPYA